MLQFSKMKLLLLLAVYFYGILQTKTITQATANSNTSHQRQSQKTLQSSSKAETSSGRTISISNTPSTSNPSIDYVDGRLYPTECTTVQSAIKKYISEQRIALDNLEKESSAYHIPEYIPNLTNDLEYEEQEKIYVVANTVSYYKIMSKTDDTLKDNNTLVLNFDDGMKYCRENFANGTLLTIKSAEESRMIVDWLFQKIRIPTKVWLGARREKNVKLNLDVQLGEVSGVNNYFRWIDIESPVSFTNWHKCEPNSIRKESQHGNYKIINWDEGCLEMYSNDYPYTKRCDRAAVAGNWNDKGCNEKNVVICKKFTVV